MSIEYIFRAASCVHTYIFTYEPIRTLVETCYGYIMYLYYTKHLKNFKLLIKFGTSLNIYVEATGTFSASVFQRLQKYLNN